MYRRIVLVLMFILTDKISNGFYVQPDIIRFSSHPQSQVAVQNSTVTFQCTINRTHLDDSLPNVAIVWVHNGNLTNTCSRVVNYDFNSTIVSRCVIESVQITANEGWYQCHVIDGINETLCVSLPCIKTVTVSRNAHLKVISETVQTSTLRLSSNSSSTILHCFVLESVFGVSNNFEVVWKKDGQYLNNDVTETFRILHSHNLLITTNSSTVQDVVGVYECHVQWTNHSSLLVTRVNVLPSLVEPDGVSSQVSLSLMLSSSLEHIEDLIVSPNSSLELICLFTGLPYPHHVTWTHNNVTIGHDVLLEMNEWLPGNYCCSSGELISCSNLYVLNSEPLYSSTLYPDVNTTVLQLDCNSSLPVHWLYNGHPITHNTGLTLTGNWSELYGIYQCTRFNETIALYRVLPSGWTNPVTQFEPVAALPPMNLSLRLDPPSFIGTAINNTSLLIRVVTFIRVNIFKQYSYVQILTGPHFQTSNYTESGDYTFHITVVNSLGDNISETIISSVFTPCMLYAPVPPLVRLTCGNQVSLLEWTQSSLDPYPTFTDKHITIECFNGHHQVVYTNQTSWVAQVTSGSVIINSDIGTNGTCTYTMQARRALPKLCTGNPVSGVCSVATTTSMTFSLIPSSSSSSLSDSPSVMETIESTYLLTESIVTSPVAATKTSYKTSVNVDTDTMSSVFTSPVSESAFPSSTSMISPVNDELIVITATLFGLLMFLIVLFLLLFMTLVVWRQRRIKKRYVVTSTDIYEPYGGFSFQYATTVTPTFLIDDDAKSITTCYGDLNFTGTSHSDDQEEDTSIQDDYFSAASHILFATSDSSATSYDSTHSPVDHSGRYSTSCNTQYSSEYLDIHHLTVDSSSSSTQVGLTIPVDVESTVPTAFELTLPTSYDESSSRHDSQEHSSSLLKILLLQEDTSHDKSDPFHTYENMAETVQ